MINPWPIYALAIIGLSSRALIALRDALRVRRGVRHPADAGDEEEDPDG